MESVSLRMIIFIGLLTVVACLLASEASPEATDVYEGEWPTYTGDRLREEKENVYKLGPRQSYQETSVEAVQQTVRKYLDSTKGMTGDEMYEFRQNLKTSKVSFATRINTGDGSGLYGYAGATREKDQLYPLLITFRLSAGVGPGLAFAIGVPAIRVEAHPHLEPELRGKTVSLGSVFRIWGKYEPEDNIIDGPPLSYQIRSHKAIFVGPSDEQDLQTNIDEAIELAKTHQTLGSPVADIYVFAAQCFPQNRRYAEGATAEIEKLLSRDVPQEKRDPRATRFRYRLQAQDWEKRYFLLLGWVQENRLQNYDRALAAYRRVYTNYNQAFGYNDDALMFSARILARTGKTKQAQALYQRLLKDYPDCFWSKDAKTELDRLNAGEKATADWPDQPTILAVVDL